MLRFFRFQNLNLSRQMADDVVQPTYFADGRMNPLSGRHCVCVFLSHRLLLVSSEFAEAESSESTSHASADSDPFHPKCPAPPRSFRIVC
jgi:hypothetical protein